MTIENINEKILEYSNNIEPITGKMIPIFTPQLNTFKIVNQLKKCSPEIRQDIVNRFVKSDYYRTHKIDEELYPKITIFLLDQKISEDDKKVVSTYLTNDIKMDIFEHFLKNFIDNSHLIKKEKQGGEIINFYSPKFNGVPISQGINFEVIQNILLGKRKITDENEFVHLKCFIDSNSFFEKDYCPQVVKYYKELFQKENYKNVFQNYFIRRDNEKLNEIINFDKVKHFAMVNRALKQYILKSIPQKFDLLEKSIYIYAKLCQILEYDNIYYLNDKSDNHIDEYNISNYNLDNNKVVCYIFSYILSDLLHEAGVENIKESQLINHKFKNAHAFIEYLIDDIAIMADSTHKGVEEGDLSKLKFSNELKGIRCSMFDLNKQNKFKNAKNKILKYLEYEDTQKKDFFPSDEEISKMNDLQRIITFNNCINSIHLYGINLLAYAQELKKKLNCNISISCSVGNNPTEDIILAVRINPYSLNDRAYKDYDIKYYMDSYTKNIVRTNQRDNLQTIHR